MTGHSTAWPRVERPGKGGGGGRIGDVDREGGPDYGPGPLERSRDGKPLQQLARGGRGPPVDAPLLRVGVQACPESLIHEREKWEGGEDREGGGGACFCVVLRMQGLEEGSL